jgi:hypothetical protein
MMIKSEGYPEFTSLRTLTIIKKLFLFSDRIRSGNLIAAMDHIEKKALVARYELNKGNGITKNLAAYPSVRARV